MLLNRLSRNLILGAIHTGAGGFLLGKAGNYIGDKIYGVGNYIMP